MLNASSKSRLSFSSAFSFARSLCFLFCFRISADIHLFWSSLRVLLFLHTHVRHRQNLERANILFIDWFQLSAITNYRRPSFFARSSARRGRSLNNDTWLLGFLTGGLRFRFVGMRILPAFENIYSFDNRWLTAYALLLASLTLGRCTLLA